MCVDKNDTQIFGGDSAGNLNIYNSNQIFEQFNNNETKTKDLNQFASLNVIGQSVDINDILIMNNHEKILCGCGNGDIVSLDIEYLKKVYFSFN